MLSHAGLGRCSSHFFPKTDGDFAAKLVSATVMKMGAAPGFLTVKWYWVTLGFEEIGRLSRKEEAAKDLPSADRRRVAWQRP